MAEDKSEDRGFAAMAKEDPERQRDIASEGGQASSGKFEKGSQRASEAGKKGAENEPEEARREGGEHSHDNDNN
jgi:general stress protein YciG